MKKLIILFLALSIFSCSNKTQTSFNLTDHIPESTEIFIATKDLGSFITQLDSNEFLKTSSFPLKAKIGSQLDFIKYLNTQGETGISFSNLTSKTFTYTLQTKKDSTLIQLDSVRNKSIETIKEGNISFQKIELEGNTFFLHEKGSSAIISNSRQLILDIGNNEKILEDQIFQKAYNASDPNKSTIFIRHGALEEISGFFQELQYPGFNDFAEWSVLDLDLTNSEIKVNGIALADADKFFKVFSDTSPKNIESAKVCPDDFLSMYALSYSSFDKFYSRLQNSRKDSISPDYPEVLTHTREITSIRLKEGDAIILNAIEIEAAKESLAGLGTDIENYRGSSIIELNEPLKLQKTFSGLLNIEPNKFYTIIDHFIILTPNIEVLKKVLTNFQNAAVISDRTHFNELMTSLSSESSMLFVTRLPEFIDFTKTDSESRKLKFRKNSLAAFQVISEGDFAHLHGVFSNSESAAISNGPEQVNSFKLDKPLATNPVFFKNHRTDQMDIAVQDENNVLHLISNKGNLFWKEQLDSQITSPVYQVDLFKNGNQQLAFSTGYNLEVLDRDGNKVKGFPIKFNNALTQPLAVFDYDKNRTYRFVLTQNNRVYMVGPKGKAIKGFDFNGTESRIIQAPKHIRLGAKDYILVPEESGKLHILSRQGNTRVPVTETFEFSENEWYGYEDKFISTAPQNELIEISQQGQVSKENLQLAENNRVAATGKHLVYLNENKLSINGKILELDYGLYTHPQIFKFQKSTLIAITDTQTQKVYVFDSKGKLLEGFPVYGTSPVDIANADLDSRLEIVVQGEANEILIYKL
ncbi:hypothetical protein [Gramella sp. KN1008]|uniref:hypothetical protein n=1 Tax=Gramella sp. KN1008 TaxID=2529298 RepID=UPI00103F2FA8|nr:hypothetical protein [Gramella sp. KN1008]TBW28099.1 hypothetical protein EZJ28_10260 [Gramella sp. KN1008]